MPIQDLPDFDDPSWKGAAYGPPAYQSPYGAGLFGGGGGGGYFGGVPGQGGSPWGQGLMRRLAGRMARRGAPMRQTMGGPMKGGGMGGEGGRSMAGGVAGQLPGGIPGGTGNPNAWQGGQQLQQDILTQFRGSGAYGPMGDPRIIELLSRLSGQDAAANERRAVLGAELGAGNDPLLRSYAGLQARIQGGSDRMNAIQSAILRQLLGQQDFGQSILANYLGGSVNRRDQKQGTRLGIGPVSASF